MKRFCRFFLVISITLFSAIYSYADMHSGMSSKDRVELSWTPNVYPVGDRFLGFTGASFKFVKSLHDFGVGLSLDWPAWDYNQSSVFVSLLGEWNALEHEGVDVSVGAKVSLGREVVSFETWSNWLVAVTPYVSATYSLYKSIGIVLGLAAPLLVYDADSMGAGFKTKGGDVSLGLVFSF